jgi:hypothetical protein
MLTVSDLRDRMTISVAEAGQVIGLGRTATKKILWCKKLKTK